MNIIVFDIEASCEDRKIKSNYNMETIEIGAVKIINHEIVEKFQTFIEPEYTQNLTPYCEELTGITYADLEGQPVFSQAIIDFYEFIKDSDIIFSCGDFDRKFLIREIEEKCTGYVYDIIKQFLKTSHQDLRIKYNQITGNKKAGMSKMLEELEIPLEGAHHRALSDAENLSKVYLKLEEIKDEALQKQLSKKRVNSIVHALNKKHGEYAYITIISYEDNKYVCEDKVSKVNLDCTISSLLGLWADVIRVDLDSLANPKDSYLTKEEIKLLKKYF